MRKYVNRHTILADGRWRGSHGIGRFSKEILSRLQNTDILGAGPPPLSLRNLIWQSFLLARKQKHKVFFNPGFNPIFFSSIPYILTLHDLIHLRLPYKMNMAKKFFYQFFIKRAVQKAHRVFTVSEYSKQDILSWSGIANDRVVVIGNGVSEHFKAEGAQFKPGFPYLLHVGNTKQHKNIKRLLQGFALAALDCNIKLIFTGQLQMSHLADIQELNLQGRVLSHPNLSESALSDYYRGALGVVFPSLHEGFGLPVLEGMASGVPVLTAKTTSLPEVGGDAVIYIDPYDVDSLAEGISQLVNDQALREKMIHRGLARAHLFSWDNLASKVQKILETIHE